MTISLSIVVPFKKGIYIYKKILKPLHFCYKLGYIFEECLCPQLAANLLWPVTTRHLIRSIIMYHILYYTRPSLGPMHLSSFTNPSERQSPVLLQSLAARSVSYQCSFSPLSPQSP